MDGGFGHIEFDLLVDALQPVVVYWCNDSWYSDAIHELVPYILPRARRDLLYDKHNKF